MSDYRHGWTVSGNIAEAGVPRSEGLTHYDLADGRNATWNAGADDRFGEPVFVPRSDDAAEGDGWVLSVIYRAAGGAQRPRGVRGDRHRPGPGGACPFEQQGAGGLSRQLAAGFAVILARTG